MWANMGHGLVDWPAYVKSISTRLCPQTPFVLEIISYKWASELPYLKPEIWSNFPKARRTSSPQFVAMARRGKEYTLPPGRPQDGSTPQAEQAQQKFDLEESLQYCRNTLGLGTKG